MEPAIPPDITMDTFSILYPAFKEAKRVVREVIGDGEPSNITIVWFETIEQGMFDPFSGDQNLDVLPNSPRKFISFFNLL